ncbi:MAG: VanW family protein [Patescibacteria group bacterium]
MKGFGKLVTILGGLVLLTAFLGIGFEMRYADRAYPGVEVAGVGVGGKTRKEIVDLLTQKLRESKQVELRWGTSKFGIDFERIDFEYDYATTADSAVKYARNQTLGGNLKAKTELFSTKKVLVPVAYFWDENKLNEMVSEVVTQIDIPAREPEFELSADKKSVHVVNGEDGQEVNKRNLIFDIRNAVGTGKMSVEMDVRVISPKLTAKQLSEAQMRAEKLIEKKVIATFSPDQVELVAQDITLFTWIDPVSGKYKASEIDRFVGQLAAAVNKEAQNASFKFVGDGRVEEFKPAKRGYALDAKATAELVNQAILSLENGHVDARLEVVTKATEPSISTGDINDLGIKELIGKGESWFSGSITNRIFNLQKAAAALNGVLVPPGETFSFIKTVGEISGATGYKQAYVIQGGKTVLGDGGGVCQVSSTLFRAILNAGLPIDERIAHAFRVSYYEERYQPGFDATIFQPSPDFKFRNDTGAHILIQTEFDEKNKHLVFLLYGTNDGRVATVSKARIWDVVPPPPPLYQDDPTLIAGKLVQTEHSANGSKVAFDWKVTRGDEVLQERTFFSSYRPWQAVYLKGTRVN